MQFGFSALIDIYTQSPYYVNKNSVEFLSLEEAEKKKATRKGANLMILVDQFEEFFTNTENYSNGKTSVDSQLVVNLILETSRIALEKDIPIYVVCTMRSDYIGQCASFRGLPEAIGFSQFFVPRLKRNEVYQVIQEPALLNGNKISKRLIEVLINEMNDGIDQLPVLQHALNQVWQIADKGQSEMDLIHFAKIGGLDTQYLTKDDKKIFDDWFEKIPEYKKRFFEHPSLDNVLDGHANDLYYRAYDYLKTKQPDSKITIEDTQLIIRNSFKCLTKIDQSRGVRNRMTLNEIVNIIDETHITEKEVATVLEIFRLQGNTFLKPFYSEGGKENDLHSDSVLDITHESLIRNWSNLIEWAHEENEDYHIWLDFEKQLHRWIENDKSQGYLLPIGPLNFFETWMSKKNPNKYWLVKYDVSDASPEEKVLKADSLLKNAHQFIKKSSRKLFVSKTILKYGADRIAILLSTIVVLVSCVYLYFDYNKKENNYILASSESKGMELLKSPKVKAETKAQFILLYENTHPGTIIDNLNLCGNDSVQIRTALEIFNKLKSNTNIFISSKEIIRNTSENKLKIATHLFDNINQEKYQIHVDSVLSFQNSSRLFWLAKTLDICQASIADSNVINKINDYNFKILEILYNSYVRPIIANNQEIKNPELFNAVTFYLIGIGYNRDKINYILKKISPFESKESKEYFQLNYSKNSILSSDNLALKYNGGYELLASLYAYLDKDELAFNSIDSVIAYDDKYANRYNYGYEQVAFSHWLGTNDTSHQMIQKLAEKNIKTTNGTLEELIASYSFENMGGYLWLTADELMLPKSTLHYNYLEYYTSKKCKNEVYDWYQKRIWKLNSDPNEVHFKQANIFKFRASVCLYQFDTIEGFKFLDKFKELVSIIDKSYLNDTTTFGTGTQSVKTTRKIFLLFPSYISTTNLRSLTSDWANSTNYFFEYYLKWGVLDEFEFNDNELQTILKCIYNDINNLPIRYVNLYDVNRAKEIFMFIHEIKTKFKDKDKIKEITLLDQMIAQINPESLYKDESKVFLDSVIEKEYLDKSYYSGKENVLISKLNILKLYLFKKIRNGKINEINKFIHTIENVIEKNNLILDLCIQSLENGFENEAIILLLEYIKTFNPNKNPPPLFYFIVGRIGGFELLDFSKKLLRDSDENRKPVLIKYMIRGMARKSEYHSAMNLIPSSISSNSELEYINEIMRAEFLKDADFPMAKEKSWLSNIVLWSDQVYENNMSGNIIFF